MSRLSWDDAAKEKEAEKGKKKEESKRKEKKKGEEDPEGKLDSTPKRWKQKKIEWKEKEPVMTPLT